MYLDQIPHSSCYATGQVTRELWIVNESKLGDFILIISNIESKIPIHCFTFYQLGINGKFNSPVFHIAYVGKDLICKITPARLINYTEEICGFLQINIDSSCDAVIQKSIIKSNVISGRLFT